MSAVCTSPVSASSSSFGACRQSAAAANRRRRQISRDERWAALSKNTFEDILNSILLAQASIPVPSSVMTSPQWEPPRGERRLPPAADSRMTSQRTETSNHQEQPRQITIKVKVESGQLVEQRDDANTGRVCNTSSSSERSVSQIRLNAVSHIDAKNDRNQNLTKSVRLTAELESERESKQFERASSITRDDSRDSGKGDCISTATRDRETVPAGTDGISSCPSDQMDVTVMAPANFGVISLLQEVEIIGRIEEDPCINFTAAPVEFSESVVIRDKRDVKVKGDEMKFKGSDWEVKRDERDVKVQGHEREVKITGDEMEVMVKGSDREVKVKGDEREVKVKDAERGGSGDDVSNTRSEKIDDESVHVSFSQKTISLSSLEHFTANTDDYNARNFDVQYFLRRNNYGPQAASHSDCEEEGFSPLAVENFCPVVEPSRDRIVTCSPVPPISRVAQPPPSRPVFTRTSPLVCYSATTDDVTIGQIPTRLLSSQLSVTSLVPPPPPPPPVLPPLLHGTGFNYSLLDFYYGGGLATPSAEYLLLEKHLMLSTMFRSYSEGPALGGVVINSGRDKDVCLARNEDMDFMRILGSRNLSDANHVGPSHITLDGADQQEKFKHCNSRLPDASIDIGTTAVCDKQSGDKPKDFTSECKTDRLHDRKGSLHRHSVVAILGRLLADSDDDTSTITSSANDDSSTITSSGNDDSSTMTSSGTARDTMGQHSGGSLESGRTVSPHHRQARCSSGYSHTSHETGSVMLSKNNSNISRDCAERRSVARVTEVSEVGGWLAVNKDVLYSLIDRLLNAAIFSDQLTSENSRRQRHRYRQHRNDIIVVSRSSSGSGSGDGSGAKKLARAVRSKHSSGFRLRESIEGTVMRHESEKLSIRMMPDTEKSNSFINGNTRGIFRDSSLTPIRTSNSIIPSFSTPDDGLISHEISDDVIISPDIRNPSCTDSVKTARGVGGLVGDNSVLRSLLDSDDENVFSDVLTPTSRDTMTQSSSYDVKSYSGLNTTTAARQAPPAASSGKKRKLPTAETVMTTKMSRRGDTDSVSVNVDVVKSCRTMSRDATLSCDTRITAMTSSDVDEDDDGDVTRKSIQYGDRVMSSRRRAPGDEITDRYSDNSNTHRYIIDNNDRPVPDHVVITENQLFVGEKRKTPDRKHFEISNVRYLNSPEFDDVITGNYLVGDLGEIRKSCDGPCEIDTRLEDDYGHDSIGSQQVNGFDDDRGARCHGDACVTPRRSLKWKSSMLLRMREENTTS